MKRSIRKKLTMLVVIMVASAFLLCGISCTAYFWNVLKTQVISDESHKICQISRKLSYIQEELLNVSKTISINSTIQRELKQELPSNSFEQLVREKDISKALFDILGNNPYFYNCFIVTDQAVYSSLSNETQDNLASEEWYQAFKATGARNGFTQPHESYIYVERRSGEVISFIMSFYDLETGKIWLGDLVVHVNFPRMIEELNPNSSLLNGYALYSGNGSVLYQEGALDIRNIPARTEERHVSFMSADKNTLLVDRCMSYDWTFVSEVSNQRLFSKLTYIPVFFCTLFCSVLALLMFVLLRCIRRMTNPIKQLTDAAAQVGQGNFHHYVEINSNDELQKLGDTFNLMSADLERYVERSIADEKMVKDLEISRLMLQINPHFIYNTLNSIVYMAQLEQNPRIADFSKAFIALLQDTLQVSDYGLYVPLEQELRNIEHYLILQKYRYPERFDTILSIDPACKQGLVPNVLLQPLVENAIFHGICGKEGKGELRLTAKLQGDQLFLSIEDDGVGIGKEKLDQLMKAEQKSSDGMRKIGLYNVQQRLLYLYGDDCQFSIRSVPGEGTSIAIVLPYHSADIQTDSEQVHENG